MDKIPIDDSLFIDNNLDQRSRYKCPECEHLLKDAVQVSCGHWLCRDCAQNLFGKSDKPICPRADCEDVLVEEDGEKFFPDKFVRKEIDKFQVKCKYHGYKCPWTGVLKDLKKHLEECCQQYVLHPCQHCGETFSISELSGHESECPKAMIPCPYAHFGCEAMVARKDRDTHLKEKAVYHSEMEKTKGTEMYESLSCRANESGLAAGYLNANHGNNTVANGSLFPYLELNKVKSCQPTSRDQGVLNQLRYVPSTTYSMSSVHVMELKKLSAATQAADNSICRFQDNKPQGIPLFQVIELENMRKQLTTEDSQVRHLQDKVQQLEATLLLKTTENEDRDFRLSLLENSNYDGTMLWKIPQFSQRREDATTGKYTSIFSLPFHSGRYGYKMCLRLYILGDGIGKGTHMSLFFVLMKGEFDNILQWPFNHKVIFKLINQCGGRDVVDVFQPDPLSSSFQKPKTDMNIASGSPRFILLQELVQNGFIVDDTIFVKAKVQIDLVSS